ncbi:amylo-alpha-1,6-glucosidase [Paractinoplanes durhamensis]|uniref:Glycoside hydrolase family 37 n=1 Tax=Paractinoplanes durhamensis TaxID=113563 RepID=A0ABQ3YRJ1_9ACTN|nr:trehalase family glycosidase [Actinoplanes durhamensis]GIE00129.1 glycoside hydrolase family 37 [Actinoplanes durhamensis]
MMPFSRRGSYYAVSALPDGVYLRTVRGDARNRELLHLGTGVAEVNPGRLTLTNGAEVVLAGSGRALIRTAGPQTLGIQVRDQYDVVLEESPVAWRFVDAGANRNYRIRVVHGAARLDATWDGERTTGARLLVTGPALLVVDEYGSAAPAGPVEDLDAVAADADADFAAWQARHGGPHRLAAFVTWAAMVPAGGMLRRESMLMSKNRMTNIWSWDHCFNAMALWRDPAAAADQIRTLFDHQDEHGCLPDYVNDAGVERNFVKPPVHGWAIAWLMDRNGLPDDAIEALYEPLGRWTDWWFEHRGAVPSYYHGNDSGWDNSTVFAEGVPVQSPDLLALLSLQMTALARIARRLDRPDDARRWSARAATARRTMSDHFWAGGRFVARHTVSQRVIESDSLLTLMPLVLGDLLPKTQFDATVQRLLDGGYLTEHGPATEPPDSPSYVADGYWRGPIWAPTTMLLVDGLRRGGRPDLADDITRRFLATCAAAGMAENFDARTGAALRDPSMTWTASVFLVLARP